MQQSANDHFIQKLQELKRELEACQSKQSVTSCMNCSYTIGCELRKQYVKSVYESMSKGETGGFEF